LRTQFNPIYRHALEALSFTVNRTLRRRILNWRLENPIGNKQSEAIGRTSVMAKIWREIADLGGKTEHVEP